MLRRITPLLAALALAGCAASQNRACNVDADCASGTCQPDGTCAELPDGGASDAGSVSAVDGGSLDGGQETDGGAIDGGAADAGSLPTNGSCVPNHDGVIRRSEVPIEAGLHATFRIGTDVPVSTAGTTSGQTRTWDFSAALQNDESVLVDLKPVAGAWYADSFPGATYAARLTQTSDLLGVFEASPDALLLRGVVSPQDGFAGTKLTYDPPVAVLQFPLSVGKTWKTDSTVSGYASGVIAYYSESYDSKVDAQGDVRTPFATFPSLRVRTDMSRLVGMLSTTTRTFVFATECFGTIAGVTSRDNERAPEFTRAAELRRLAP